MRDGAMSVGSGNDGGWWAAGLMTIVSGVMGALAYMFKLVESKSKEAIDDLQKRLEKVETLCSKQQAEIDDCKEDRSELKTEVAILKAMHGKQQ